MAVIDDLKAGANSIRKAGNDAQTRLQNLTQLSDLVRKEAEQIQQLVSQTQSEIQNFETLAREFEKQAQVADEIQKKMQ